MMHTFVEGSWKRVPGLSCCDCRHTIAWGLQMRVLSDHGLSGFYSEYSLRNQAEPSLLFRKMIHFRFQKHAR